MSLRVGREKVLEMTQRLGVVGVKKTCSMALGDTGITPLQHTGAYATFANGGKLAKPYAILEMFNSKGELIYSRDKRRARGAAGREPQGRRGHEHDDAGGGHRGHRPRTARSTSPPSSARPAPARAIATPGSSASPARW